MSDRIIGTSVWAFIIGGTSLLATLLAHMIVASTVEGIRNARACGAQAEVCIYEGHGR